MHRNSDDRHWENSCAHTRQMSCHTCACNDNLEAFLLCGFCIFEKYIRLAVCRDDFHLVLNSKFFQHVGCFAHYRHIRVAAHHNSYFSHVVLLF